MHETPPYLYHYTTVDGLVGILGSKVLWATSIRHLNDSSEFRYTVALARYETLQMPWGASGSYAAFLEPFHDTLAGMEDGTVYVASFSAVPDLLSQWRAYGQPGLGVAIGFRTEDLEHLATASGYTLLRCHYTRSTHEAALRQALTEASEPPQPLLFGKRVLSLAPIFKHPSFSEEAEWRLLSGIPASGPLRFRRIGSLLAPYRCVSLAQDGPVPISEVLLAPSLFPDENAFALQLLLAEHGLPHVPVRHSQIPYRTR